MKDTNKVLQDCGIIPVIKIDDANYAVSMAKALNRGGIHVAEVTFRSACAPEAISLIAQHVPEVFVCAGTVLTVEQAKTAVQCGAKAVISPGLNPQVVSWCLENAVPVYPGCATPTEIEAAMALGLSTVKLFPAAVVGGVAMLKALYGPYNTIQFMPTGGISVNTVTEYLQQPNVIACGGSWICTDALLQNGDFIQVEENAREAALLVKQIRES